MSRIVKWMGCALVFGLLMSTNPVAYVTGQGPVFSTAEAIVGRPATPVSVAGVARRSVRRRY